MYRVSFHTTWDESDEEFFESIKRQTPNESGEWGQIKGTVDEERADYHVVFNKPRKDLDESKTLLFSAEPPVSSMYDDWATAKAAQKFPIESHHKPQRWWVDKTYDELKEMDPPTKTRDLSWITTDKGLNVNRIERTLRKFSRKVGMREKQRRSLPIIGSGPLDGHVLRMEFYERLVSVYPDLLDLYGRGQFNGEHYGGEIADKWTGLKPYRYSLAIENYSGKNYFSEKISDALLAWNMPIYWGCSNLEEYLPKDSYVQIDIENRKAPQQVKEIVESDLREKYLDATTEARTQILDKYQIWPTVEEAIKQIEN